MQLHIDLRHEHEEDLTMKHLLRALLVLALLASAISSVGATGNLINLTATANGANEVNAGGVPNQGDPDGSGSATFTADPTTGQFCWDITVANIALPATITHIHRGAAGANGPVVIDLTAPNASGRSNGCIIVATTLINEIIGNAGGFYLNVYNAAFPAGAVRGQLVRVIVPVVLSTSANGANEVSAAGQRNQGDPDGTGSGIFTINTVSSEMCYTLAVSEIGLPATGAHIHSGAAGTNGPILISLNAPDASGRSSGCITLGQDVVNGLINNPAGFYLNIYNAEFPAGAVRGQLGRSNRVSAFNDGRIDGSFMYPIYARTNGIEVYNAASQLLLRTTSAEIAAIPAAPAVNTLIEQTGNGFVTVYRLTSGELQINIGPDGEGKVEVYILAGLPTTEAQRADFQVSR
jgi:hypothetical protein